MGPSSRFRDVNRSSLRPFSPILAMKPGANHVALRNDVIM
jgi:hypothetical protein